MKGGVIALALLSCAACGIRSEAAKLLDRQVTGEVLLESYTVEMTWGYQVSGMYIDADGSVWAYEHTGTPWYPEKLKPGELSVRDMLTKHKNPRQIGSVDPTHLRDVAAMIKPAARGKITRVAGPGVGTGSLEVAYLFDPHSSVYHEIVLAGQGDRVARNSAPEAQLLIDYLRDVKKLVASNVPPP
jgi:hypothetical protein